MHSSNHSKYHGVVFKNHPNILSFSSLLLCLLLYFRNRSKEIDVSDIEKAMNDTAQLHDKIKQKLNKTKDDQNITSELLDKVIIFLKLSP